MVATVDLMALDFHLGRLVNQKNLPQLAVGWWDQLTPLSGMEKPWKTMENHGKTMENHEKPMDFP